jgi:endonuclease III
VRDTHTLVSSLREFYGPVHRPPSPLFQFVVWELLSEHATTGRRDLAWNALRKIPALTPDAMFRAPVKELTDAIALAGGSRDELVHRFRGVVDTFKRQRDALDEARLQRLGPIAASRALRAIPQLHDEIRRRALLFSFDFALLPVDDDSGRVICRLTYPLDLAATARLSRPRQRRDLRNARGWLKAAAADVDRKELLTYLRHHGRHTCVAVGPHCAICPLAPECRSRRPVL